MSFTLVVVVFMKIYDLKIYTTVVHKLFHTIIGRLHTCNLFSYVRV